jgi:hypothetical protein
LTKQTSKEGVGKVNIRRIKMTRDNTHISILIVNVNGHNAPVKRPRIANWVKKQDPTMLLTRDSYH